MTLYRLALVAALAATVSAGACSRKQEPPPATAQPAPEAQPGEAAPAGTAEQGAAPSAAQPVQPPPAASAARPQAGRTPATSTAGSAAATDAPPAAPEAPAPPPAPPEPPKPEYRDLTVPAGTTLTVVLDSTVASDTSKVEDLVQGHLSRNVRVDGLVALPAGSKLRGTVVEAAQSAKVKGRARIAFRFNEVRARGERFDIATSAIAREAQSTKGKDAKKIGIGAAAGAIIGGIAGGGKGAAIGAGVGGGAGTGVVMATRGEEVRLEAGQTVTVSLTEPITVTVEVPM